jgi:LysR family glycine cleavage system transcriptional activator
MKRLPLGPIEAFVLVARSGSLGKAADVMNLTVPALSRRIQLLEHDLGVRLFRRMPRGLVLTEAGDLYLSRLTPAWDVITEATEAARLPSRDRTVKVSVMPTFAANWLMPRLARFQSRAVGMELEVETSAGLVDLQERQDLDCAIRLGKAPWPGLVSESFLPVDAFPVASPDFLTAHAAFEHPQDLLRHTLVGSHHQPDFWLEWWRAAGMDAAKCRYRSFDNLQLVYEAAAANLGIAIGLGPVVGPYLDSGRLIRVFPASVRLSRSFHLVRRNGDTLHGKPLEAFRNWLLNEAGTVAAAG